MTLLSLGVIGSSAKENERRLPLHPEHVPHLEADLRARITLEHGYGESFGVSDEALARSAAGFASRAVIVAGSDVVLLPSPSSRTSRLSGRVRCSGLAALRPGPCADPGRHRPRAHAHRLRGDEPLDPGR